MPESDDIPDLDRYIGAEVLLNSQGKEKQVGRVVGRLLDKDGKPVGSFNKDPLFDTRVYEVMFPDGTVQQYSSNLIAEAVYDQCNEDGRRHQFMDELVDYVKSPDAIEKHDGYTVSKNGQRKKLKTTKG